MNNINSIGPIKESGIPEKLQKTQVAGKDAPGAPSFQETLKTFMTDVNSMQLKADESINKMAAGEITDVHQVMNAVEEANTSFTMMMEIRNKVMDAYQEVLRMRL
jgi:flagellar hook-basal body complex protein FliE